MTVSEQRRAARIILRDEQGRFLLLQHKGSTGKPFWAPPGGGLERNETFEEAAIREAAEELGIEDARLRLLWESVAEFIYIDRPVRQQECFFLIEATVQDFSAEVLRTQKQEGITQAHWWTIAELETTLESVFPEGLAGKLRENFKLIRYQKLP